MRRFIAETPARVAEVNARDGRRPVLRGRAVDGCAWDEYEKALAVMEGLKGRPFDYVALSSYSSGAQDAYPAAELVEEFAAALAHLSNGAARTNGQRPLPLNLGIHFQGPNYLAVRYLAHLAVCRAHLLAGDGRFREALDTLFDALTFAHDLSYNTTLLTHLFGLIDYGLVLDELRLLLFRAPPEEFAEVARRLEIVDASFPDFRWTWTNDALHVRIALTDMWNGKQDAQPIPAGIAAVVGMNHLVSNAIASIDDFEGRLARMQGRSWSDARRDEAAIQNQVWASWNPITRRLGPRGAQEQSLRRTLARLRLLRAYAMWRSTGTAPDLTDPFGGTIRSDVTGPRPRFWSRGVDGNDERGVGAWDTDTVDIVLEQP